MIAHLILDVTISDVLPLRGYVNRSVHGGRRVMRHDLANHKIDVWRPIAV